MASSPPPGPASSLSGSCISTSIKGRKRKLSQGQGQLSVSQGPYTSSPYSSSSCSGTPTKKENQKEDRDRRSECKQRLYFEDSLLSKGGRFEWISSYRQRAYLVKMKCEMKRVNGILQIDENLLPESVCFFSLKDPCPGATKRELTTSIYTILPAGISREIRHLFLTYDDFIATLPISFDTGFDLNDDDSWKNMVVDIEKIGYKKELNEKIWMKSDHDYLEVSDHDLFGDIKEVLATGMCNGSVKNFTRNVFIYILSLLGKNRDMRPRTTSSVSMGEPTASYIIYQNHADWGHEIFNAKRSGKSSNDDGNDRLLDFMNTDRITMEKAEVICDNVIIMAEFPGFFVIEVESKSKSDSIISTFQGFSQGLTHMHFQDDHFVIILSPNEYSVLYLKKYGAGMFVSAFTETFAKNPIINSRLFANANNKIRRLTLEDTQIHSFSPKVLTNLCNWYSWIIRYGSNMAERKS